MRVKNLTLAELEERVITIGFVDENLYTQVRIDCKELFDEHPDAIPSLAVQPPQGDAYPAVVTREGDIVVWNVAKSDVQYANLGRLQLTFVIGEIVAKSYVGKFVIDKSLMPDGEAPTPIENWITEANAVLGEIPGTISEAVDDALEEAKESGEFDGADGVSPTVTVTKTKDGHNVVITDAEGDHSFDVPDGTEGKDGVTPQFGIGTVSEGNTADVTMTGTKENPVLNFVMPKVTTEDIVAVQDTQPTAEETAIWFPETPPTPVQVPTYAEHLELKEDVDSKVADVKYKNTSLVNQDGVAQIPPAQTSTPGLAMVGSGYGLKAADPSGNSAGRISTDGATSSHIRFFTDQYRPITPYYLPEAVFRGLAKVAGDNTQTDSQNPVGTYTDDAKEAIQEMLNVPDATENETAHAALMTEITNAQEDITDVKSTVDYGDIMDVSIIKQGGTIQQDGTVSFDPNQTYYFVSQKIDVSNANKIRIGNYYKATTRPTATILNSEGVSVATIVNPESGLNYVELDVPSDGVSAYVQATSSLTPTIHVYASYEKINNNITAEKNRIDIHTKGFDWYELVETNNLSGVFSNATTYHRNGDTLVGYVTKIYDLTNIDRIRIYGTIYRFYGKKTDGNLEPIGTANTSYTGAEFNVRSYNQLIVGGLVANFWGENYVKVEGYKKIESNWRNRKIVWFGTSIPAGGFKGEDNPLSYPFQVGRKLGATVFNEAVGDSGVHYRELSKVSATNPYGFNFYFVSATRCLTNTIAMMEWIGNWADYYCNGGTYKNPEEWDSTIFTSGLPSTWTDADTEAIKQFSYEIKLDKYLTDDTCPDLFVFDHGYNDRIRWADNTGTYEAQLAEYGRDNCYTFRGAMNFLIDRIYTFKPTAKIVLIGDYEAQSDEKKYDSIYQQRVADDYEIPIFKRWEKTGWSQVQETMNAAWDSGLLTVKSTSATKTLLAWNLADGVHPHSDKTGGAIRLMADLITPFIESV